jgi:hypothetical protein
MASQTSIFAGAHVAEHNLTTHGVKFNTDRTIWSWLSKRLYKTGLVIPIAVIAGSSNFECF